jgi:hypothetical protein
MARDCATSWAACDEGPPAWRHIVARTPSWRAPGRMRRRSSPCPRFGSRFATRVPSWRRPLGAFRADLALAVVRDAVDGATLHSNLRTFGWLGGVRPRHGCLCRHGPCTLSVNCDATVRRPTLAHPPASPSAQGPRRDLGGGWSSAPAPRRMSEWAAAPCTPRGSRHTWDPAGPTPSPQAPVVVAAVPERRKASCSSCPGSGAAPAAEGFRQSDDSSSSSPLTARV